METQKELKDTKGFDWLESTELVINKRKFLLNCMKSSPFHKIKTRTTTFVLLRFIKNCKQSNFKCVYFLLITSQSLQPFSIHEIYYSKQDLFH